jgi:hypothetical protein
MKSFMNLFYSQGILTDDPRITPLKNKIDLLDEEIIDKALFFDLIY